MNKLKKYEAIKNLTKTWLKENEDEIKVKHHVQEINVNFKYIDIFNLCNIPKSTEKDVCESIDSEK
jgi:hypothetical protein